MEPPRCDSCAASLSSKRAAHGVQAAESRRPACARFVIMPRCCKAVRRAGGSGRFTDFQIGEIEIEPADDADAEACEAPEDTCPERLPVTNCTEGIPLAEDLIFWFNGAESGDVLFNSSNVQVLDDLPDSLDTGVTGYGRVKCAPARCLVFVTVPTLSPRRRCPNSGTELRPSARFLKRVLFRSIASPLHGAPQHCAESTRRHSIAAAAHTRRQLRRR